MAIFRERLPSKHDMRLLSAACVVPVHAWAILSTLQEVPSFVLPMTGWELLAASAYTMVSALIESLMLLAVLTLVVLLLPARFPRERLAANAAASLYASLPWVFLLLSEGVPWYVYLIPVAGWLVSLRLVYIVFRASGRITALGEGMLERFCVLSYLYVILDVLAAVLVVARNI